MVPSRQDPALIGLFIKLLGLVLGVRLGLDTGGWDWGNFGLGREIKFDFGRKFNGCLFGKQKFG